MLLSSFELLFEPITPKVPPPINPGQNVPDSVAVQAYFVLISNVGNKSADLKLEFTSTPNTTLSLQNTFTIFDITNTNFDPVPLNFPSGDINKGEAKLPTLNSNQTALFLLQPDIATLIGKLGNPPTITKANFGVRGYVNVSSNPGSKCLISPQTRGTFLNVSTSNPPLSIVAQEAYPLQTPNGNLFSF